LPKFMMPSIFFQHTQWSDRWGLSSCVILKYQDSKMIFFMKE
jgi:hypothetical protein